MKLNGKKVGILIENGFYEPEIWYYNFRFPEDGGELHFLTRLWGREKLSFTGNEYQAPFECKESFEAMSNKELDSYDALIVPAGIVADRLRYTEDPKRVPPATTFLARAFRNQSIVKGIICHGMWLVAPMPELVRGRSAVVHNNLIGDARNMGVHYVDQDVVVDSDLVTARTGRHCGVFARTIIDMIAR